HHDLAPGPSGRRGAGGRSALQRAHPCRRSQHRIVRRLSARAPTPPPAAHTSTPPAHEYAVPSRARMAGPPPSPGGRPTPRGRLAAHATRRLPPEPHAGVVPTKTCPYDLRNIPTETTKPVGVSVESFVNRDQCGHEHRNRQRCRWSSPTPRSEQSRERKLT